MWNFILIHFKRVSNEWIADVFEWANQVESEAIYIVSGFHRIVF